MIVVCADVRSPEVLDLLRGLPVASVITDPPYSSRVHDKALSNNPAHRVTKARDLGFAAVDDELRAALATVIGIATRWSLVFSDLESAHVWRDAVRGAEYVRTIPWVRWSQPQLSGDRPPSGAELVTVWHARGPKAWSGPGSLTAFESHEPSPAACVDAKSLRGSGKHPTEKPLDLMLDLVAWFSAAGQVVVDPCCGSGTTGQACRILGRVPVCLDLDPAYAALAEARLTSPLSDRDRDRLSRWVERQTWCTAEPPDTVAGRARYEAARADVARARAWLA